MVKFTNLIIKGNRIVDMCIQYNIEWHMTEAGITIYHSKSDNKGTWFALATCEKAIPLIMQIANVTTTSQLSLNSWL